MLVSNGHVQLECSIFSPQKSLPFIKPGEKRERFRNVGAGREGYEKPAPVQCSTSSSQTPIRRFFPGPARCPVQGPGALAFWHTLFAQCMLPTRRSCPPRGRNCGQTMRSAISKSASRLGTSGHTGPSFSIVLVLLCTFSNSPTGLPSLVSLPLFPQTS